MPVIMRAPSFTNIALVSVFIFLESFIAGVIPILQEEQKLPTNMQFLIIFLVAALALVVYVLSQIKVQ